MTRELLKANDGANPAAFKELLCGIKHVVDIKHLGLKIEPMGNANKPWEIVCFTSSDYAGDPVSRRSISGFILYVLGVPVSWQSKFQKSMSFSSSEADYITLSKDEKEMIFVIQLLRSMKIWLSFQSL